MSSDPRPTDPPTPRKSSAGLGRSIGVGSGDSSGARPTKPRPAHATNPPGDTPPQAAANTPTTKLTASLPPMVGRFRVIRLLGRGGMGIVLEVEDVKLGRRVAAKMMLPEYAHHPVYCERFFREAQAQARVNHKYIVPIYEFRDDDGPPYLIMPLIDGQSLDQRMAAWTRERRRLNKRPGLRWQDAFPIVAKLTTALVAVHKSGLIHRDIKPSNVMLERVEEGTDERVKLLDFGVVRLAEGVSNLTQQGDTLGTPHYMAPEQTVGDPHLCPVDHRADLFSLGAVIYELLTGEVPFAGNSLAQIVSAHISQKPVPVRALNPRVPEALAELVHSLLATNPKDRTPSTAEGVLQRLLRIRDDYQTTGSPLPPVPHASDDGALPPITPPMGLVPARPEAITAVDRVARSSGRITGPSRPTRRRQHRWLAFAFLFAALFAAMAGVVWVIASTLPVAPVPTTDAK